MTWVTAGAGGASSSRVRVDTPVQSLSSTENFVTQWKSECTSVRGSAPKPSQSQVTGPPAVAPNTLRSQVSDRVLGTGP